MIHGQRAFGRTKPNIWIAMHIVLDLGHSQIRSEESVEMWEHEKVMTEATPRHSSCQFSWNSAHPSKIWQVPIELWREKTMYTMICTVQIVSCFWVKREESTQESACGAKSTRCESKKIILRKNEPNWDILNQSQRYFLLEIYHQYRYCVFDVNFVCHFWNSEVTQT